MSAVACPHCNGERLRYVEPSVMCLDCGATGPEGATEREAIRKWNERYGVAIDEQIRLEEEPDEDGSDALTMRLYFGHELVASAFVRGAYVATMRGALMLIGGMRKAEELEAH